MEHITEEEFDEATKSGTVLVEFGAIWCSPCRSLEPVLEEVANSYPDTLKVVQVNADESRSKMASLGIQSIPTCFIYKDGKQMERMIGFRGKDHTINTIKKYLPTAE